MCVCVFFDEPRVYFKMPGEDGLNRCSLIVTYLIVAVVEYCVKKSQLGIRLDDTLRMIDFTFEEPTILVSVL